MSGGGDDRERVTGWGGRVPGVRDRQIDGPITDIGVGELYDRVWALRSAAFSPAAHRPLIGELVKGELVVVLGIAGTTRIEFHLEARPAELQRGRIKRDPRDRRPVPAGPVYDAGDEISEVLR